MHLKRQDVPYLHIQQLCQLVKFTDYSSSSSNDDDGGGGGGGGSGSNNNNNNGKKKKGTIQLQVNILIPQHTNSDTCMCVQKLIHYER